MFAGYEVFGTIVLVEDGDFMTELARKLLEEQHDGTDPEKERKEIRGTLGLMREKFESGLYEGAEYIYW
jgi:hypothetical protein